MEVKTQINPELLPDPFEQEDMLMFDLQVDLEHSGEYLFGQSVEDDWGNAETAADISEKYGHSLATIRRWGEFLIRDEVERPEAKGVERVVYDDFKTRLVEMIKTDPEFRDRLDVEARNEFEVQNGQARWADGTPFSEMLQRGLDSSRETAREDPRLLAEVERAEGDLHVAEAVDALKPGESYFALSMEPKDELAKYGKLYEKRGYRNGIAYMQWYSRTSDGKLVAGSFSIDQSDAEQWREVGAKIGMNIPENEKINRYIRHGITLEATADEAQEITRSLRDEYYSSLESDHKRFSISEYVDANESAAQNIFDSYYPQIARALASGENTSEIQAFADGWAGNTSSNTSNELINKVWRIALSDRFSSEDGRVLNDALSYAAVERLRNGIDRLVRGENLSQIAYETLIEQQELSKMSLDEQARAMNSLVIGSINAGVSAGRTYGSCGGSVTLNSGKDNSESNELLKQQEAFGGLGGEMENADSDGNGEKKWKYKTGVCQVPKCPTRPGVTEVGPCSVCKNCEDMDNEGEDLMTLYSGSSNETEQGFYDLDFDFIIRVEQAKDSSFGDENKILAGVPALGLDEVGQNKQPQGPEELNVRIEEA